MDSSSSTRLLAAASSALALSAADRPSAIFLARSSSAAAIGGHTNFIVNQTRIRNTIIWMIRVAVMLTFAVPRVARMANACGRLPDGESTEGIAQRSGYHFGRLAIWARNGLAVANHSAIPVPMMNDGVDQAGQQEHLGLQFAHQLGLARSRFEVLAAHDADADAGTDSAETDDEAGGQRDKD